MLLHLPRRQDLLQPQGDVRRAREAAALAPGRRLDLAEARLGRLQEVLAPAGALLRQERVAERHQALARKELLAGDLRHVDVVEQRRLQGSVLRQRADRGRPERTDPVQAGGPDVLAQPRVGEHAAVADQDDPFEAEAGPQPSGRRRDGGRIGRVAPEDLHGDRPSLAVAHEAELDLQPAPLAVAGVAELRERAVPALHPDGGQVPQHQGALAEMPPRKLRLDALLPLQKPVHGAAELVLVGVADAERLAERVARAFGGHAPGRRELRPGRGDAGHDHGDREVALPGRARGDGPVEAELAERAERGRDGAVGQRGRDLERVLERPCGGAPEAGADLLDEFGRQPGEVGEGALADLLEVLVPPCLAEQHGGRGVSVGDGFDIHGHAGSCSPPCCQARISKKVRERTGAPESAFRDRLHITWACILASRPGNSRTRH